MRQPRPTRRRATTGTLLAVALLASWAASCAAADSDYFGPNEPTWVRIPLTFGDSAYVGIAVVAAHDGDVVTIESVEFGDVQGAPTIEPLAAVLNGETRLLGAISESDVGASVDLDPYRPAPGLRFQAQDGPVALAARITGTAPVHGFGSVIVRLRLEGRSGVEVDVLPYRASVCAAATFQAAVAICRPIADQMRSFGM